MNKLYSRSEVHQITKMEEENPFGACQEEEFKEEVWQDEVFQEEVCQEQIPNRPSLPNRTSIRNETNEEECNFNIDDEEEVVEGKKAVNQNRIRSTKTKLISFTQRKFI